VSQALRPVLSSTSRSSPSIPRSSRQDATGPYPAPLSLRGLPGQWARPPSFPPARACSQEENSCPGLSVPVAVTDSVGASAVPTHCPPHPTPRALAPTLLFLPKGQRLARLRPEPRSSGRPSDGVPRLLSEGARFMGWLKSSNSTSPGRAKPDLCCSMRTWESWGRRQWRQMGIKTRAGF
jgi:hypothetical protein